MTGARVTRSVPFLGVARPRLGGVAGDGMWISVAYSGARGYVERVDLRSMRALAGTVVSGSGGIEAQIAGGVLWVTQSGGGPARNYCADPISGRRRVTLPFLSRASFIGANRGELYYVPTGSQDLIRVPIDPRCR